MSTTTTALIRNADEAERRWFYGGGLHRWLVREGEVGDGFLLFEDTVDPGKRTPLHTHPAADETFYLLDGLDAAPHRRCRARGARGRGRGHPTRSTTRVPGPGGGRSHAVPPHAWGR